MVAAAMAEERFWDLVEQTGSGANADDRLQKLNRVLDELSPDELISFEVAYRLLIKRACTWDLWGAAYVIHGGCSDDGFDYFRDWLISRGRDVYETALADAESLAKIALSPADPDGVWEFEELRYIASDVFKEKGGDKDLYEQALSDRDLYTLEPSGDPFDEDDAELEKRFPKLWRRFGENPLG